MHGKLLKKTLIFLCVIGLSYSCVDKDYDLKKIDKFVLPLDVPIPLAYMKRDAMELLTMGGLSGLIDYSEDAIFLIYQGSFKIELEIPDIPGFNIWEFAPGGILDLTGANIPPFVREQLQNVSFSQKDTIKIDVFNDMAESKLYFSNPVVNFQLKNYTGYGADFNIDYFKAKNEYAVKEEFASFGDSRNFKLQVGAAPAINSYSHTSTKFDKDNGGMNRLFGIAPDELIYSFSGKLTLPQGGGFLVKDKYLEVDYEARLPFAFDPGTKIVDTDTLDLDLSKIVDVKDLNDLTLWLHCKNRMPAEIDIMLTFLDEHYENPQCITNNDNGTFLKLAKTEVDADGYAQKEVDGEWVGITLTPQQRTSILSNAKHLVLKYSIQTKEGAKASIHPSDYIEFKLSVSTKINFEF